MLVAGVLAAGGLHAQTIVAQSAITAGTTTLDSGWVFTGGEVADGNTYKPTIADTSALHRDALFVRGGATLALVSGANVAVQSDAGLTTFLRVGYGDDETGTLTIASGATLAAGQSSRYANFQVAEGQRATGLVQQSGGEVTVKGSFNVGVNGGTGTYTLSGGTLTLDHADDTGHTSLANIGYNNLGAGSTASSGTFNLTGGTLNVTAHVVDPAGSPGVYGATRLILGNRSATGGAGDGTLTQSGGVLHVDNAAGLYLSAVGNGVYNLNGGTLEIGGESLSRKYNSGAGTYAFNFGGGTIKVIGRALTTDVDLTLQPTSSGTFSVFDTNGYDATLSGRITTTGTGQEGVGGNGFRKAGNGTLNLTGGNRAFNTFGVMGGTVAQSTGATTATEFMVGTGDGYTGAYVLNGGSITIDPTLDGSGNLVTVGSLRTGDFGGGGTFTQNAGTVTVSLGSAFHIGNQGGTGTYDLKGGTLSLIGNINVLGRSTGANPASTGTLNVSGGLLQLQGADARLILGNNANVAAGTGTVNQTGGTVSIANGSYLYLAGYGAGTYNLNGGTLEAGGTSLQTRYGSGTAAYAFNLGGGTLKVVGADLSAPFDAALSAATTSMLNTNGLNATWTGRLSGAGGLAKTGTGVLTLANAANSYSGATTVSGGTLSLTGHLLNSAVIVGSGGTLRGSGSAAGLAVESGGLFEPGSGVGAFTVNGDLTLAAGSTTSLEIESLVRGSGYDYITATSTFSFGGTFNLSLNPGLSLVAGNSFDLFDWGSQSGSFATVNLPGLGGALVWDTSQLYTTGVVGVTTATAVPEPATVALFAGLGALGLACWRRRSR